MIKDLILLEESIIIEVIIFKKFLFNFILIYFNKIDYKQKFVYGLSPRATNDEYYRQKQSSILGFGIYYKNENDLKCLNIDVVSDCLEQDASAIIRAFDFVRSLDIFQRFNSIKSYYIWSDCGNLY
jgi:hypothetical protein